MSTELSKKKLLWKLFCSCFTISLCTFGGGFVIVSFMKKKYVDEFGWINEQEMLDVTALAQASPGAIAVNASILIGRRMAGFWGMIVAVLGTILPPMILLSALSVVYQAVSTSRPIALMLYGMQAGVAAVILDVVWDLSVRVWNDGSVLKLLMMGIAFVAAYVFHVNVLYLVLASVIFGICMQVVLGKS